MKPTVDPELETLNQTLAIYNDMLRDLAGEVVAEAISNYPIFVVSKKEVVLGRNIVDPTDLNTAWFVNVSHLEEFVNKNIIAPEKVDGFRQVYKDPGRFACFFVVGDENVSFVFAPYEAV